jgi:hypothetical protein
VREAVTATSSPNSVNQVASGAAGEQNLHRHAPLLSMSRMTKRERDLLALRYVEIQCELNAIAEGRVVDGDPAEVEADLIDEQDEIEWTLGEQWFDDRDAGVRAGSQEV